MYLLGVARHFIGCDNVRLCSLMLFNVRSVLSNALQCSLMFSNALQSSIKDGLHTARWCVL